MMEPTQVTNGWRATARTAFAVVVALLSVVPVVLATAGLSASVVGAQVLVVTAAVTRVLALPEVNLFIERFVPWLAAEPVEGGRHRAE